MKTLVEITTSIFENYGNESDPHWKMKGTQTFKLYAGSDLFLYNEEDCIEAIELMLFEHSSEKIRYEYRRHELIFHEAIQLHESIFLSKLQSVINQNIIE